VCLTLLLPNKYHSEVPPKQYNSIENIAAKIVPVIMPPIEILQYCYHPKFKCIYNFFIVVPCILIILKLFSPTNAHFIEHIKCAFVGENNFNLLMYSFSVCYVPESVPVYQCSLWRWNLQVETYRRSYYELINSY
jgi:hypothetical protein